MRELLRETADHAADFLESLPERLVFPSVDVGELRARLGGPVPDGPTDAREVVAEIPGVEVLNEVVLNQVLFRFDSDERTRAVLDAVQRSGVAWMSGSVWEGRQAIRISVSNWQTTADDIDRTVAAFVDAAA